jgi:hypothetical protein
MAVKFLNLDGVKTLIASLVPNTRTVNGKALSSDITLSASDVSTYSKTEIDTKLSNFNTDIYYVGTSAPSNTNLFWVDTTSGSVLKYYNPTSKVWTNISSIWG